MDEQGRVEFTKEMKKDYRILIPTMLPRHLKMLAALLNAYGYHAELLENTGKEVIYISLGLFSSGRITISVNGWDTEAITFKY